MKNQIPMMKLITNQYIDKPSIEDNSYIEEISTSLTTISKSVQILSSFSHIEKLYKEEVEYNSLIEELLHNHINHELFENIVFKPYSDDIMIKLDENLIGIAIYNLINNALDEIKKDDMVNVNIDRKNNKTIFSISNPYHFEKKNIEKFGNIGFSTKSEGSGIGLPISKVIIEKHVWNLDYFIENNLFIVDITIPEI